MTTSRTITASQPGPITADLSLIAGRIHVVVDEDRTHAELTIETPDDDGPSADAVNRALLEDGRTTLLAHVYAGGGSVTQIGGGGSVTQVASAFGHGTVFQQAAVNYGHMVGTFIGGDNYGIINAGGHAAAGRSINVAGASIGGSPITITARLPRLSRLTADTAAGRVDTLGRLDHADVKTVSGEVTLAVVQSADVKTVSGGVKIRATAGDSSVKTISGDIRVTVTEGAERVQLRLRSVSGNIRTDGARAVVNARSTSGDVQIR